ncbi:MAG: hypothetical protein HY691_00050 [Chloroflexi bacterium]|nr:hypothetical protein [Chloroflexota bacterium]
MLRARVYVFGGEDSRRTYADNAEDDPATDAWRAVAPLPTPRHGLAAVAVGDAIYALAGGPTPGGSESGADDAYCV